MPSPIWEQVDAKFLSVGLYTVDSHSIRTSEQVGGQIRASTDDGLTLEIYFVFSSHLMCHRLDNCHLMSCIILTLGDALYTLAVMRVNFKKKSYTVVFTAHALEKMQLRGISEPEVIHVIETGKAKPKSTKGKFWVYLDFGSRNDNLICISLSVEPPMLIVITTLVNWRPE